MNFLPTISLAAYVLLALGNSLSAVAGSEMAYVEALKKNGFDCTDNETRDGVVCIDAAEVFVIVPKNLPKLKRHIFYAHGDFGPCDRFPGLTGENILKDQAPTLLRHGAIAVLPKRHEPRDITYPLQALVERIEKIFGSAGLPWTMAGHSSGGKFIPLVLEHSKALLRRVDLVLLLDAGYNVEIFTPVWQRILGMKETLKIKSFSSTTFTRSQKMADDVNEMYSGAMSNQEFKGVGHCEIPRYFRDL